MRWRAKQLTLAEKDFTCYEAGPFGYHSFVWSISWRRTSVSDLVIQGCATNLEFILGLCISNFSLGLVAGSKTTPPLLEKRIKTRKANPSPTNLRPQKRRAKWLAFRFCSFYFAAAITVVVIVGQIKHP